jgi:hypothetical protein
MNGTEQSNTGNFDFHGLRRIVSGGQTGVDRAALDVAIVIGLPHGGWCPKGRRCEDGRIDPKYQLVEMPTADYSARTLQNVVDSDGTLLLYKDRLAGGTALTDRLARQHGKPLYKVKLNRPLDRKKIVNWLKSNRIRVLNIAGPRGSAHPDLESMARQLLLKLFQPDPNLFE